jgi:hypothetical protein
MVAKLGGRIILRWIIRGIGWGYMDWIDLAQDKDQWRACVNTVMESSGSINCWEIFE